MRAKTGITRRKRHKKVLKRTKGMRMTRGRLFKVSHQADLRQGQHQYIGRKLRKRDLRRLWISRINAALRTIDPKFTYSRFIKTLSTKKIDLNRKSLSDLATNHPNTFKTIVKKAFSS